MKLIKDVNEIVSFKSYYLVSKEDKTIFKLSECFNKGSASYSNREPSSYAVFEVDGERLEFVDDKGLADWHVIGPVEITRLGDVDQYFEPEPTLEQALIRIKELEEGVARINKVLNTYLVVNK